MASFKFRTWSASMTLMALGGLFAGACGGGNATTTSGGATGNAPKPNGGTLNPPPVNDGTGKPPNATGFTCGSAFDCDGWACDCSDGYVVYAAFCLNGYCLDASGACQNACTTPLWNHGEWAGTVETPEITSAAVGGTTSGDGFGGASGSASGGFGGGGGSAPTCGGPGASCFESSQCCSFDCNVDTCN